MTKLNPYQRYLAARQTTAEVVTPVAQVAEPDAEAFIQSIAEDIVEEVETETVEEQPEEEVVVETIQPEPERNERWNRRGR